MLSLIPLVTAIMLNGSGFSKSFSVESELPSFHHTYEVATILEVFGDRIAKIESQGNDVAFSINGSWIHYCRGRMLSEEHVSQAEKYDSIFYKYQTGTQKSIPPYQDMPHRAPDFFHALFGKKETDIRKHCRSFRFLGRTVFMNRMCEPALRRVEAEILDLAHHDKTVARYVADLSIAYSFKKKRVIGSDNLSFHSFGLALDLVPKSYHRKQVYWRWSKVFREDWHRIPLRDRWSPPQPVIHAFEKHGFVWGGKWSHFDTIHFEYRPEILRLSEKLSPWDV